ncbi:unnamed protein product (macronuclear) [Paramecium tetraurelia]|uniref:Uncharacterized protein n=1 Tax=Paramecium tetraurelia TaxID=5888 RepID=A0CU75_PARTE|nr:uncharacterized protein GSPATT00010541001 [Paramecium tetraurelia]CAK74342.1 unnamed protein product [Paramecium tetraurelia]|eukprot:XP_001441739.1 hypothetical protein (macronuclear) [Paramecium tetraurelia strain d4-2]
MTQERVLEIKDQNEIRNYFTALQLSNQSISTLESLQPQDLSDQLVYLTIQIIDVLDQDVFIGAVSQNNQVVIYPLGCESPVDGQPLYFDKQAYTACILDPNHLYKPTKSIVTLYSNFNDPIKPKIFNKFNILALKHQYEDEIYFNVIKYIQPTFNNQINKLQLYQQLINNFNLTLKDPLASELLALHLLSSSKYETYAEGARQIFNIYGLSKNDAENLKSVLQSIYSPTLYIPLEYEYLANIETLSKKNFDENTISQGLLCIPTNINSQIVVDETLMKEGQISGKTVQNLQNIQKFIQHSKIGIDFQYSMVEVPVQTNVLILSTGKSFIQTADSIKINPQVPTQNTPINYQGLEEFVSQVHQQQQLLNIDEELKKKINSRYIELRQLNDLKIDVNNLNNWILQMKILSVIKQEESNYNNFEYAVNLDIERIKRNM